MAGASNPSLVKFCLNQATLDDAFCADTHRHPHPHLHSSLSFSLIPHTHTPGDAAKKTTQQGRTQTRSRRSKEQTQHRQPQHETVSGSRFLAAWWVLTNLHARQMRKASGAVGPKAATNNHLATLPDSAPMVTATPWAITLSAATAAMRRTNWSHCAVGRRTSQLWHRVEVPRRRPWRLPDTSRAFLFDQTQGLGKWRHWRTVKGRGSAKAPRRCGRGSAHGLGSLRSGFKAGEEDSVED